MHLGKADWRSDSLANKEVSVVFNLWPRREQITGQDIVPSDTQTVGVSLMENLNV